MAQLPNSLALLTPRMSLVRPASLRTQQPVGSAWALQRVRDGEAGLGKMPLEYPLPPGDLLPARWRLMFIAPTLYLAGTHASQSHRAVPLV